MGKAKDNVITKGFSGRIGRDVVFKQINGETFYGKYADRTRVKYSKEQLKYKKIFAAATRFASDILHDPAKRDAYPRIGLRSVYHCALADYMASHTLPKSPKKKINIGALLDQPSLNERQKKAIKYLVKRKNISNAVYQKLNAISKATSTRDLQALVQLKIFTPPATKGAGAIYTLKGV